MLIKSNADGTLAADSQSVNRVFTLTLTVILVPKDPVVARPTPLFFTRKLSRVRDVLTANGVSAGPVQQDRQGTSFFDFLDSEGNTIEVSERP